MVITNGNISILDASQSTDAFGSADDARTVFIVGHTAADIAGRCTVAGSFPAGGGDRAVDQQKPANFYHAKRDEQQKG